MLVKMSEIVKVALKIILDEKESDLVILISHEWYYYLKSRKRVFSYTSMDVDFNQDNDDKQQHFSSDEVPFWYIQILT